MSKLIIVLLCALGAVIVGGILAWQLWPESETNNDIVCTQEAKTCPDGSSVSRTGPNCEFAECSTNEISDWQLYTNKEFGFEFNYPKDLNINLEEGGVITLKSENRNYPVDWSINVHSNDGMTLQEWAENSVYDKENITSVSINGIDAKKINWGDVGTNATIIGIAKADLIYEITGINRVSSEEQQEEYDTALFEQMLSTFKFINN